MKLFDLFRRGKKESKKEQVKESAHEEMKRKAAEMSIASNIRIAKESVDILNKTTNPATFFSRYDLVIAKISELEELETDFNFTGENPSVFKKELVDQKVPYFNAFINDYYKEVHSKIEGLKSEKAKMNNAKKFRDILINEFVDHLEGENIAEVEKLYAKLIKDFDLEV